MVGTPGLLEAGRAYWSRLAPEARERFRFLHISTDEVYGSLGPTGYFTEQTPYDPRSPYSASKAASEHLVRSRHEIFGLPTIISNCSNNYASCYFPKNPFPLSILSFLEAYYLTSYRHRPNNALCSYSFYPLKT